jgi:tRNA nucleotidyltransferase/poly(A) polymerase
MDAQLLAHLPLKVLQTLYPDFPETGQLCLVGGAVRDALLDRPVSDFDFTSPGSMPSIVNPYSERKEAGIPIDPVTDLSSIATASQAART